MRFCGKEVTLSRVSIKKAQHPTSRSFLFEKKVFVYNRVICRQLQKYLL